jgi:hypothetical protein
MDAAPWYLVWSVLSNDVTNAFGVPPEELGGLPSSAFIAKAFTGAKLVKGFNHLGAAILATDPVVEGGHRVVFLSSDDEDAISPVADLAKQLGFAPVKPGTSTRVAHWCMHAAALGVSSSSRICSRSNSNQSMTARFGPRKMIPKRRIRPDTLDVREKERFR